MTRRLNSSIEIIDDKNSCCRGCRHVLASVTDNWKSGAIVKEIPVRGAGGSAYTGGDQYVMRQFICPGCGRLLDAETAMPKDPFLEDRLSI